MVDPCVGQHIMCKKGSCVLGVPGDAAADAPAPKDASSLDAAAKGASSAAPGASTVPKATDASAASARD
jgi:hypothetical protein